MESLLVTAHVLAAVLVTGPLMWAPFAARRAIMRRAAQGVRVAETQLVVFGAASFVTAGLGLLALMRSTRYDLGTRWIIVSITLYAVALVLVFGYAAPALRTAGRLVEEGVPVHPEPAGSEDEEEPETATLTATATQLRAKERLDAISARIGAAGTLTLLVFAAIVVLMTAKPF
ncbi:MAG: DUF2269 family protein [Micromonosporaceae bacterium]